MNVLPEYMYVSAACVCARARALSCLMPLEVRTIGMVVRMVEPPMCVLGFEPRLYARALTSEPSL